MEYFRGGFHPIKKSEKELFQQALSKCNCEEKFGVN
jgi:hypothetical protein